MLEMSGLVFTLLLTTMSISFLDSILKNNLGFKSIVEGETWRGLRREGRWDVEVFIKKQGKELQFFLPDRSIPKEICEEVVKKLSKKIYSLITKEAFKTEYVIVVSPTPSFCCYCLESVYMPFRCLRCGGYFCSRHRLPEKHNCPGGEIEKMKTSPLVEIEDEISEKPSKRILIKEIPCG